MKTVRTLAIVLIAVLLVVAVGIVTFMILGIAGVAPNMTNIFSIQQELVNEQSWDADTITSLNVSYGSEKVTVYPSADGRVTLREYMSNWEDDMLATTAQSGGSLSIEAGQRPILRSWLIWNAHIELYLPVEWLCDVRVENNSGGIAGEGNFNFSSFAASTGSGSVRMKGIVAKEGISLSTNSGGVSAENLAAGGDVRLTASSGSVRPGKVQGKTIYASTNSGSIRFERAVADTVQLSAGSGSVKVEWMEGRFELGTNSGSVTVEAGRGHGSAETGSGSVKVTLEQLDGDLRMKTNSGGCRLTLPSDAAFNLAAHTGSGGLHVPDGGNLSYDKSGNITGGGYGAGPVYNVELRTGSGSVRLEFD